MGTGFVQMQHGIEYMKIGISVLKTAHIFIEHLLRDQSGLRTARSRLAVTELHDRFIVGFLPFSIRNVRIIVRNFPVGAFLLFVIFLYRSIE